MISIQRILCPTDNNNGHSAKSVAAPPFFIESLAPHLGLKSFSELNWEGLVAENVDEVGIAFYDKRPFGISPASDED